MTQDEFDQTCRDICPHCKMNNVARYRIETNEWCHDFVRDTGPMSRSFGHSFCTATDFRNEWKGKLSG